MHQPPPSTEHQSPSSRKDPVFTWTPSVLSSSKMRARQTSVASSSRQLDDLLQVLIQSSPFMLSLCSQTNPESSFADRKIFPLFPTPVWYDQRRLRICGGRVYGGVPIYLPCLASALVHALWILLYFFLFSARCSCGSIFGGTQERSRT